MRHADLNMLSRPSASSPVPGRMSKGNTEAHIVITEEIDISTTVDELEQLNSEEATRNRAERARAKRKRFNPIKKIYKLAPSRRIYTPKIGVQDYPRSKMS
ncbi:hypothetical protein Adt_02306 [Abeliophyllum distichum]|uniref:Uncharacterized protein n=1 Tax=Abeliophyllum distichum TaxID=126358 RepID=A0ABD1VXD6_9LAMI